MTCKGYQYEIGKTYKHTDGPIKLRENGFHCCKKILKCLNYYKSKSTRFCEVKIGRNSITEGDKTVTDTITILRELEGNEG